MIEAAISSGVLQSIKDTTQRDVAVGKQLSGGWNFGAFQVALGSSKAVLKVHGGLRFETLQSIRSATEEARKRSGWPTPQWIAIGETTLNECWSVQEFVSGKPPHLLDRASAEAIVRANRLQAGLAEDSPHLSTLINRSEISRLMLIEDRWGHQQRLSNFSTAGARLLKQLRTKGSFEPLPEDDLVHGDLNQENILMEDGEVATFVDTDELGTGPRVFDLVDLFHRSLLNGDPPEGREVLRNEAVDQVGEDGFRQCFATTVLGTMSWVLERMPEKAPERIDLLNGWLIDN